MMQLDRLLPTLELFQHNSELAYCVSNNCRILTEGTSYQFLSRQSYILVEFCKKDGEI